MTDGIKVKVVVITGAGKGLGRAYALYLVHLNPDRVTPLLAWLISASD